MAARAEYRAVSSNKFLRLSTVPRTGAVRGSAGKRGLVMMINEKGLNALNRDKAHEVQRHNYDYKRYYWNQRD